MMDQTIARQLATPALIFMATVGSWVLSNEAPRARAKPPVQAEAPDFVDPRPAAPPESVDLRADPFRAFDAPRTKGPKPPDIVVYDRLDLEATWKGPKGWTAVISGKRCNVGTKVGDWVVKKIDAGTAVLQLPNGKEQVLRMKPER